MKKKVHTNKERKLSYLCFSGICGKKKNKSTLQPKSKHFLMEDKQIQTGVSIRFQWWWWYKKWTQCLRQFNHFNSCIFQVPTDDTHKERKKKTNETPATKCSWCAHTKSTGKSFSHETSENIVNIPEKKKPPPHFDWVKRVGSYTKFVLNRATKIDGTKCERQVKLTCWCGM